MRTITIEKDIYKFEELSDKAKEKVCYDNYIDLSNSCLNEFMTEYLHMTCEALNIAKSNDYEYYEDGTIAEV